MARLVDLLTRESKGRLHFDRFSGGLIVADAIYAQMEAQASDDAALYIEDEIFIDGEHLPVERYTGILPPFDSFWIEARSARHAGAWVGILCKAYQQDKRLLVNEWVISMYPIVARERGGGRLEVICPRTLQLIVLTADGNLITARPMIHQAPSVYAEFHTALRLPEVAVDVAVNAAPLVLETLALLSCMNVQRETVSPPAALSRSHQKKYGAPMSSYTVLTYKGRNISETPHTHSSGSHASPRQHMVRRHFKVRNGQRYLWNPHLRGNPEKGRVAVTRQVELSEDHHG